MDKKVWYWISGILIVVVLLFVIFRGNTESANEINENTNVNNIDSAPARLFADIETSDDVFNEIDAAVDSFG